MDGRMDGWMCFARRLSHCCACHAFADGLPPRPRQTVHDNDDDDDCYDLRSPPLSVYTYIHTYIHTFLMSVCVASALSLPRCDGRSEVVVVVVAAQRNGRGGGRRPSAVTAALLRGRIELCRTKQNTAQHNTKKEPEEAGEGAKEVGREIEDVLSDGGGGLRLGLCYACVLTSILWWFRHQDWAIDQRTSVSREERTSIIIITIIIIIIIIIIIVVVVVVVVVVVSRVCFHIPPFVA